MRGIQMEKKIQSYQYIISESDTSMLKSRKWRDEKANYKCIPKMWENENESKPEGETLKGKRINSSIIRPSFLVQRSHPDLSPMAMKIDAVLHIHFKCKMKEENK